MKATAQTTLQKALTINLDLEKYGAFAEIGAGQEVARHFFQAGKASSTVAKTMSAYDMTYSDEIYGREESGRYVCQSRLAKMLAKEYDLLEERLRKKRGANTCFFAFADTVATSSDSELFQCRGWIGVRFQTKPGAPPSEIQLHVRMTDRYRLQQQEALGILGVNLIYTAFYHRENQGEIIPALIDNIKPGRVAIDMIHIQGEGLSHINTRLLNLELVRRELTEAVMFTPDGEIVNLSDSVYGKSLFIQRGAYRPITTASTDILKFGINQFYKEFSIEQKSTLSILELTMSQLETQGHVDEQDFLDRVASLKPMGCHIMVSNFFLFYPLKSFLRRFTQKPIAMTLGALHLERLFDEKYYSELEGGILEGLGTLLSGDSRLYVYPYKPDTNTCVTSKSFFPKAPLNLIYRYFQEQGKIVDIAGCEEIPAALASEEIRKLMSDKNPLWEKMVPKEVVEIIKKESLFSFRS